MRNMLERLQTIIEEQDDNSSGFHDDEYGKNKVLLSQEAVVFENSTDMENTLKEVHSIRKDMSLLHLQVEQLCIQNERFGSSVRRLTLLKKDSDSIGREILQHTEALYARIQALGTESRRLEENKGPHSAVSRIARLQYDMLVCAFHTIMSEYNRAEEMQRRTCRERIQRQTSIMGADITDEQLDVLVDKGGEGWNELSQNLQTQGVHSSRWAMCEIRGRHMELVELEARLKEVHNLFLQMALLVEEQGSMLNNIEANVTSSQEYVEKIDIYLKKALQCKRKNPFLHCCPCLSFWRHKTV